MAEPVAYRIEVAMGVRAELGRDQALDVGAIGVIVEEVTLPRRVDHRRSSCSNSNWSGAESASGSGLDTGP